MSFPYCVLISPILLWLHVWGFIECLSNNHCSDKFLIYGVWWTIHQTPYIMSHMLYASVQCTCELRIAWWLFPHEQIVAGHWNNLTFTPYSMSYSWCHHTCVGQGKHGHLLGDWEDDPTWKRSSRKNGGGMEDYDGQMCGQGAVQRKKPNQVSLFTSRGICMLP